MYASTDTGVFQKVEIYAPPGVSSWQRGWFIPRPMPTTLVPDTDRGRDRRYVFQKAKLLPISKS